MKKTYIRPELHVEQVRVVEILAGSPNQDLNVNTSGSSDAGDLDSRFNNDWNIWD